ncbi:hypothetical protein RHT_00122 [Candidatus Rhabdochlamydia sp. T3358]|nr:hypothetical protein RHT_00122 [Candidatus Rhabdochlamydia sp. T3358]
MKGIKKRIESRLFSNGPGAVCVSVNSRAKTIGIKEWDDSALGDFLTKKNPVISAINDDSSLEFEQELRDSDRSRAYDLEAEVGITRWCRTEKGELVIVEEEPVTETTMSVASGNESTEGQDILHIKRVEGEAEKNIFRLFNGETKKTLDVPHKNPKTSDGGILPKEIGDCTFEIINTNNGKQIALHKTHPLDCFMLGSDLFTAESSQVEEWVYEQFYRGPDDKRTTFEYTNFVSARKKSFSFFGKGIKGKRAEDGANMSSEVETWRVEMKISASCVWQFPVGLLCTGHFF